jgi:hypothetical protein
LGEQQSSVREQPWSDDALVHVNASYAKMTCYRLSSVLSDEEAADGVDFAHILDVLRE